jgi:hypothetical protein
MPGFFSTSPGTERSLSSSGSISWSVSKVACRMSRHYISAPHRVTDRPGSRHTSWTSHHGRVGARFRGHRWSLGGVAFTVLVLAYGPYGVSVASGSSTVVGTPTHPQILTCNEEATQFTGGLPPTEPHDIGFGPGYFPQARRLATMNPQLSSREAQLFGYKLPPVVYPGATVTVTIARGARSYVVKQNPWSPRRGSVSVTYQACLHKRGFFPQSFRFTDGRRRGCVPLDVRVDGQRKTHNIVLSLFAGRCRSSF